MAFETDEISYNKEELGRELVEYITPDLVKTVPIIQCFGFTFVREDDNKWTIYFASDYGGYSITIPELGKRNSFFIHNPYRGEEKYETSLKSGTHMDNKQLLDLIVGYRFRFLVYPIVLDSFTIENGYDLFPEQLLPYHKLWTHKSLDEICNHNQSLTPNICLGQRDLVYYIFDRLSTCRF